MIDRDRVACYCPVSTRSTLVTFAGSIGTPASGSESVGAQYISGASISTACSISWMSDSRSVSASSARYPGNSIRTGGSRRRNALPARSHSCHQHPRPSLLRQVDRNRSKSLETKWAAQDDSYSQNVMAHAQLTECSSAFATTSPNLTTPGRHLRRPQPLHPLPVPSSARKPTSASNSGSSPNTTWCGHRAAVRCMRPRSSLARTPTPSTNGLIPPAAE